MLTKALHSVIWLNGHISKIIEPILKKTLQLRIQWPWFQDNFFIKYTELFFVKIFFAKWNSYLYAQYIEFSLL